MCSKLPGTLQWGIRRFAKDNVNKFNILIFNVSVVPVDVHFHYIDNAVNCMA